MPRWVRRFAVLCTLAGPSATAAQTSPGQGGSPLAAADAALEAAVIALGAR